MRNIKKSLLLAIAMVIATTLVISSVGSVQVTEKEQEINELTITKSDLVVKDDYRERTIPDLTVE